MLGFLEMRLSISLSLFIWKWDFLDFVSKESDPFILGDNDLSKEKYPYLYQMAERARDALHCSGDIVITVTGECNIGIKKVAGYYNIELGVMLAGIESEDELLRCSFMNLLT